EQLATMLLKLGDIEKIAGTEKNAPGLQQGPRAGLAGRRQMRCQLHGHAFASAWHAHAYEDAVIPSVDSRAKEGCPASHVEPVAKKNGELRIITLCNEDIFGLGRVVRFIQVDPEPSQRVRID